MNSTLLNPMGRKVVYGVAMVVGAVLWTASMWAPQQYIRGTESIGQIVLIVGNLIAFLHTITRTADGMPPAVAEAEGDGDLVWPTVEAPTSPPVIVVNTGPNDVTATVTTEDVLTGEMDDAVDLVDDDGLDLVEGAPWPENWPPPMVQGEPFDPENRPTNFGN